MGAGSVMLVFWDQRLAFVATPKTGSTAIATALESYASVSIQRPPVLKHTTVMRYHRFMGPYLQVASGHEFELCAVMREPRDWLASWYRYRQREDLGDLTRSTREISFDTFVRGWCQDPAPDYAAVGSQAQFFKPRNGKGVDHLFRYDQMDRLIGFLETRLKVKIDLPRVNVSPSAPVDLSPETERLLQNRARTDFEIYNSIG
jgi:hypothetical protein